jgi:competence protein ComEC
VISVGARNRYGLPHPATLEAARRHGARLLRTDRDGTIRVRVGHGIRIERARRSP